MGILDMFVDSDSKRPTSLKVTPLWESNPVQSVKESSSVEDNDEQQEKAEALREEIRNLIREERTACQEENEKDLLDMFCPFKKGRCTTKCALIDKRTHFTIDGVYDEYFCGLKSALFCLYTIAGDFIQ